MSDTHTIDLNYYEQNWPGSLSKQDLWDMHEDLASLFQLPAGIADITPKEAMWAKIHQDYTLSNHPSHIACQPPDGNKPATAI